LEASVTEEANMSTTEIKTAASAEEKDQTPREIPSVPMVRQERPHVRVTPTQAQAVLRVMQAGLLRKE
jgi:hypothetical protein